VKIKPKYLKPSTQTPNKEIEPEWDFKMNYPGFGSYTM
jgi:hypothetical protein